MMTGGAVETLLRHPHDICNLLSLSSSFWQKVMGVGIREAKLLCRPFSVLTSIRPISMNCVGERVATVGRNSRGSERVKSKERTHGFTSACFQIMITGVFMTTEPSQGCNMQAPSLLEFLVRSLWKVVI